MSKILIVGNSKAVVEQIVEIRKTDTQCAITFFSTEGVLPYDRAQLPHYFVKDIKEAALFSVHDKFFTENKVEVIAGEKLARISVKRRHLTTESKRQIGYDKLVLVDTGVYKLPDIKGHHKRGVYQALSLNNVKDLMKSLIDIETVFLSVTNFQGFNLACALARLEKDVVILAPHGVLSAAFDDETVSLLKQIVEAKGIRVLDQELEEILGDQEVKAVRLKSGKVMAAQAVIFDIASVDTHMFSEQELQEGDVKISEEILNPLVMPFHPTRFGCGLFDGYVCGVSALVEGGREYLKFDGPANIFKKIFIQGDKLLGVVLFNAPSHSVPLTQLIESGESVTGREDALLEA